LLLPAACSVAVSDMTVTGCHSSDGDRRGALRQEPHSRCQITPPKCSMSWCTQLRAHSSHSPLCDRGLCGLRHWLAMKRTRSRRHHVQAPASLLVNTPVENKGACLAKFQNAGSWLCVTRPNGACLVRALVIVHRASTSSFARLYGR